MSLQVTAVLPEHCDHTLGPWGGETGPLSLLGLAGPAPTVALSPSRKRKRKGCITEGRRQTEDQLPRAAEGTTSALRTARAPMGWYLPPSCSITSFATRKTTCRCVLWGHVPTNSLQTERYYKLLSARHPNQNPEKKKSKQKGFPLFVPQVPFRLNDVVQREVSIVSPYRFFLLHKIRGFFFPFGGKFMLLLNAFTYKLMCLWPICLGNT